MSEPSRLLDGGDVPELEKSLLRSWSSRHPSDGARLKTLAALGVSGAVGGVAVGGGASLAPKAAAATASVLKWLGLAGGVVATVGAVTYVTTQQAGQTRVAPPPADTAHVATSAPSAASRTAAVEAPTPGANSTESPSVIPQVEPTPTPAPAPFPRGATNNGTATSGGSRATTSSTTSSLQEEVAMIDSGRRALANGDPQATLDTVDAYDARFPGGALAQESEELRIEALFRTAKRQQAEKLAARFLSAHPTSPYARVIRGLVAAPARAE